MIFFWLVVYNFLIVPVIYLVLPIIALFDEKLREGIEGRKNSWRDLINFREKFPQKKVFLIHSASLGEFEQAKPVIRGLKSLRPDISIVASFTSPSGYKHAARIPEVDLFIYLPFDTFIRTRRFIQILRPKKIIFVMYELWPNLIFNAYRHKITTYLISARIRKNSTKTKPIVRSLFAGLYRMLDYIYAVSEEHKESLQKLIGSKDITVLALGDTRYDQVIQRAQEALSRFIQPIFSGGFVFIAGSVWPQDLRYLFPAIIACLKKYPQFKVIVAPHEPNEYALETLEDNFKVENFATLRYSQLGKPEETVRIVLIDKVGILAELYHQAHLAFVGGSFRGSIHNVMEPAVAGLPVIFGPTYHNSHEAELLIKYGGGFCCQTSEEIVEKICLLIENKDFYIQVANAARKVIFDNLGASARTVKEILETE